MARERRRAAIASRFALFFLVSAGLAIPAHADKEAFPDPRVFVSPDNRLYFRMIPRCYLVRCGGTRHLYRVGRFSDELLYKTR